MASLVLAMLAALGYGSGDFTAGLAARRTSELRVNPVVFAAATITIAAIMPWTHLAAPSLAAIGWGLASGAGNGVGAAALLAGFRRAPFSIAAPLSSVVGAGLAVLAGVALGNRPTAICWAGVLLAIPAIMAVASSAGERGQSQTAQAGRAAVWLGLAAGAGAAMSLIGLARASIDAGIWPVLAAQASAFATTLVFALVSAETAVILVRRHLAAAPAGSPRSGPGQGQSCFTAAGPPPVWQAAVHHESPPVWQAAVHHESPPVWQAAVHHDLMAGIGPPPVIPARVSRPDRSGDDYLRPDQPDPGAPAWPLAVTAGVLTGLAEMLFCYAAHAGMLSVSAVVTSLFPAVTVGLAARFTGERLDTLRLAGLGLAAVSVSLIAMGG